MTVSINIDPKEATKSDFLLARDLIDSLEAHSVSISGGTPISNVQVGYAQPVAAMPVTQAQINPAFSQGLLPAQEPAQQPAGEPAKKTRRSSAEVAAEKAAKEAAKLAGPAPQPAPTFAPPVMAQSVPEYNPYAGQPTPAQFASPAPVYAQPVPQAPPAPQTPRAATLDDLRNIAGDLSKDVANNGQAIFINTLARHGFQQLGQVTDPIAIQNVYNELVGIYMQLPRTAVPAIA